MSLQQSDPLDASDPTPPPSAVLALSAQAQQGASGAAQGNGQHQPTEAQALDQELQIQHLELESLREALTRAQTEVQSVRAQYADFYNFAPVGYFMLTSAGVLAQLNRCGRQQLGAGQTGLVGYRFAQFVAPAARLAFGQFLARVLGTDVAQSCELTLQREDGTPFFAQLEGLRADTLAGPECRLVVVDTTARRRATAALAVSEARFRKLFADSHDAVVLLQGHEFVDCNAAALRLLGTQNRADIVGRPAWAHTPEQQPNGRRTIDFFRETVADALRTGSQRCEVLMRRLTGEEIWVEAVLTPIELVGLAPLVHVVWRDITAARAAQKEVENSQERLQLALAVSQSGVWRWELATNEFHLDASAHAVFGLPQAPGPVSLALLRGAVHPHDLPAVSATIRRALADQTSFDLEHRLWAPDGHLRYVAALGKGIYDEQGRVQRLIGIVRDVTRRREAENALRREKEFSENLLENTVDGIVALDRDLRITAWNAEAARYFGQAAAAVLGRVVFDVLPLLDQEARRTLARALAGERGVRLGQPFGHRPGRFDGYFVPLQNHGEAAPSGVLLIIRDVTERDARTEEATQLRLRQQQEVLAAILTTQETERKRIAEAIHNGLGQLLYAAKLSLEGPADAPSAALPDTLLLLEEAIRATRSISFELTPGILEDFGLRVALEELVQRLTPARLPVHLHLTNLDQRLAPLVEIAVYRTVQELLNNVMKHARATEVEVHVAHESGRVAVSVEDNGCGFEPGALATRPLGGIGLSGVRNRVALLGGELVIRSQRGRGTIVSFELNT